MKILILNWRDIKNPISGGAEILTHEIAKGLVVAGHEVTQISADFDGGSKEEIVDGVRIVRDGTPAVLNLFHSVHYKAYKRYKKEFENKVDLVIDEVHGIPFFTALYVREKKILLICEVANKLWDMVVAFPFNLLGKTIERMTPLFYKNIPVFTISESSKKDLEKIGFKNKQINILPMGSNSLVVTSLPKKESSPTLIFLARLYRNKGAEDAIEAIKILRKRFPTVMLWIVGRGLDAYEKELVDKVRSEGLGKNIKFFSFVSELKKQELLTKAHVLIAPSSGEGWGLTIHEAGARATPAIVYDVAGLRDVVKNGINGIICKNNSYFDLAENAEKLLLQKSLYRQLQKGALSERKKHSWQSTSEFILSNI